MTTIVKPIWISKDGRKFYYPHDFNDNHLLCMIPFLAKGVKALDQIKERVNEDTRVLVQKSIDYRLDLTALLLEEIRRRALEELSKTPQIEDWEQDLYINLSYYDRPDGR